MSQLSPWIGRLRTCKHIQKTGPITAAFPIPSREPIGEPICEEIGGASADCDTHDLADAIAIVR